MSASESRRTESAWQPIRVVGCGSNQGDDAVAWEVIYRLRGHARLPIGVALRAVEGGHQLLDALDGCETLVLVDAVSSGGEPGTIHRFKWPDDRLESLRPGTTHDMRPAEALELAATLGLLPPRVVVFGIEAASMEPSTGRTIPRDTSPTCERGSAGGSPSDPSLALRASVAGDAPSLALRASVPGEFDGLSPAVAAAVPAVVDRILEELSDARDVALARVAQAD